MTITMDKAGRIVIPLKIRQRLNLQAGAEFDIETGLNGRVELVPKRRKGRVEYRDGIPVLVFEDRRAVTNLDVVESVRQDREARANYVAGVGGYDRDDYGYDEVQ